jgi:hypothetical protein
MRAVTHGQARVTHTTQAFMSPRLQNSCQSRLAFPHHLVVHSLADSHQLLPRGAVHLQLA